MTPIPSDDYLHTVEEVAQTLRVSKMTVYRLIHLGKIAHITVGRGFRVPHAELTNFIKVMTKERTT